MAPPIPYYNVPANADLGGTCARCRLEWIIKQAGTKAITTELEGEKSRRSTTLGQYRCLQHSAKGYEGGQGNAPDSHVFELYALFKTSNLGFPLRRDHN